MQQPPIQQTDCRVMGRLGKAPEAKTTLGGMPVCRMVIVGEPVGPATSPQRVVIFTKDELAARCARGLAEGDLIEAFGSFPEQRKRAKQPELVTTDVKLWERAERTGAP